MQPPTMRPSCRPYTPADLAACLRLFDANSPDAFALIERADYERFLDRVLPFYRVCLDEGEIVAAYGLATEGARGRLKWIMTAPSARGQGLGAYMMRQTLTQAKEAGLAVIDIAASQKSAPFFARYGAVERQRTPDGWGPGLDRIDMELPVERDPHE